jgi:hypothetical protein
VDTQDSNKEEDKHEGTDTGKRRKKISLLLFCFLFSNSESKENKVKNGNLNSRDYVMENLNAFSILVEFIS